MELKKAERLPSNIVGRRPSALYPSSRLPHQVKENPWIFANGGAQRLARAFGEVRVAHPKAPLLPELQVVLAHLMERAGESSIIEVPEDPTKLIGEALEQHLRRAFLEAFPGRSEAASLGRTQALLALRELADASGKRGEKIAAEELSKAIGRDGKEVLDKLATPLTGILVAHQQEGDRTYALAHDRIAEVLVRLVDDEGAQGTFEVDAELLELRRFVALKSELFAAGEKEQATTIPIKTFRAIERQATTLIWGKERQRWWHASRRRTRLERRRTWQLRTSVVLVALLVIIGAWRWTDRRARRVTLFEEVSQGEPEIAFAALNRLQVEWQADPEDLRQALRRRNQPFDVLERGIGGIAVIDERKNAVLRLAELMLPLIVDEEPEDPIRIASFVWALDFFAPEGERKRHLRDLALKPLRRVHPPPVMPEAEAPGWAEIPAGTFLMGSGPGEGRDDKDERPKHRVTVSAFRMGIYEVTNAEFRRLYPKHTRDQPDQLPAVAMTWYQAYTYAAWLGGRLPTEAEAEYVRRAGCDFAYCKGDGSEASLDEVAWWVGTATDPLTSDIAPRPVGQLAESPWGLYDIYGNVWEGCADWYGAYSEEHQVNPPGPPSSSAGYRISRGGSAYDDAGSVAASTRGGLAVDGSAQISYGLRVVLPRPSK